MRSKAPKCSLCHTISTPAVSSGGMVWHLIENDVFSGWFQLQRFFFNSIFFSVDDFILVEKAVGSLEKVGIKRNDKGVFDDWKLELVRHMLHIHNI